MTATGPAILEVDSAVLAPQLPHSRDVMHLWFQGICIDRIGVAIVKLLGWCKSCRRFPYVLAVNINVRSEANDWQREEQMSRYPLYPRGSGGKGAGKGRVISTPAAGSRRLFLCVDFIFSSLRVVDEIVGPFLYRVFAHLGHTPLYLIQSINKRGRGHLPYNLILHQWN